MYSADLTGLVKNGRRCFNLDIYIRKCGNIVQKRELFQKILVHFVKMMYNELRKCFSKAFYIY